MPRRMRRLIGSGTALGGVFLMIGIGGAIESGSISITAAFIRMILSCALILIGAAGVLE